MLLVRKQYHERACSITNQARNIPFNIRLPEFKDLTKKLSALRLLREQLELAIKRHL
jgi:predicted secreted Zn-dependent protease